ncbi:transposase family protein [Peptoniphilus porci]|uniref:transposase family protein n=1 Tax=Peptoniphilus porci TaxID=2652280 RepID=UPI00117BE277|nr:transposase family protein [Peptoniphilus porci]
MWLSFERELDFIAKGHTMTYRLVFAIVAEFNELHSSSSIASRYNVSSNTVLRIYIVYMFKSKTFKCIVYR